MLSPAFRVNFLALAMTKTSSVIPPLSTGNRLISLVVGFTQFLTEALMVNDCFLAELFLILTEKANVSFWTLGCTNTLVMANSGTAINETSCQIPAMCCPHLEPAT